MASREITVHLSQMMAAMMILLFLMTQMTTTLAASSSRNHHRRDRRLQRSSNQQESYRRQGGEVVCSEPAELKEKLEGLYGSHALGQVHDSFLLVPALRDALTVLPEGLNDTTTCSEVFSGSNRCKQVSASDKVLADPCPGYTCLNSDPHRHPSVLLETRCACRGRCKGITQDEDPSAPIPSCQGVFHSVRVLQRKDCREGVWQYVTTWFQLQVGCACQLVSSS